jgi:hypothetical protein
MGRIKKEMLTKEYYEEYNNVNCMEGNFCGGQKQRGR